MKQESRGDFFSHEHHRIHHGNHPTLVFFFLAAGVCVILWLQFIIIIIITPSAFLCVTFDKIWQIQQMLNYAMCCWLLFFLFTFHYSNKMAKRAHKRLTNF